jgi:hypothetical protein
MSLDFKSFKDKLHIQVASVQNIQSSREGTIIIHEWTCLAQNNTLTPSLYVDSILALGRALRTLV